MTYRPNQDTRRNLRDIYEMEGSYAATARRLNEGRSKNLFNARQVRRMLNTVNEGGVGSGYSKQDAPLPVKLSSAQQRALQRKAKVESRTYERSYDESDTGRDIYDSITNRIDEKRRKLQNRRERLMLQGQKEEADAVLEEIRRLNKFDSQLGETADKAKTYRDWKGMQDANTP